MLSNRSIKFKIISIYKILSKVNSLKNIKYKPMKESRSKFSMKKMTNL